MNSHPNTGDNITVLTARGRRLAKLIRSDCIIGYDSARIFDVVGLPVDNIGDVHRHLRMLQRHTSSCVIRGQLVDGVSPRCIRRLLHHDPETGELPTLLDVPRRWVAIDMDAVDRPADVDVADVGACAALAIRLLPEAFRHAACIAQATGSHGFKPGCRLRLWFWLSRPTTGQELKRWLRNSPVDPAVFGAAQPIYTAAPVFARGVVDPVPERIVALPGTAAVRVPEPESLAPPVITYRPSAAYAGSDAVQQKIQRQVDRVRSAPPGTRHHSLRAAARTIGGLLDQATVTEADVTAELLSAAEQAGAECMRTARSTVQWGITNGRQRPLQVGTPNA